MINSISQVLSIKNLVCMCWFGAIVLLLLCCAFVKINNKVKFVMRLASVICSAVLLLCQMYLGCCFQEILIFLLVEAVLYWISLPRKSKIHKKVEVESENALVDNEEVQK